MSYLNRVKPTNTYVAYSVESIRTLCFYLTSDGYEYIASPVNLLEVE